MEALRPNVEDRRPSPFEAPRIRPAQATDRNAALRLLSDAKLETEFVVDEFHVAESEGLLVACARLKRLPDGSYELASVAVEPALRRSGIGTRIVEATLARTRGTVHALALAPAFFGRLGFRRVANVPEALRKKAEGACASSGFVPMTRDPVHAAVRERYGQIAATRVSCCAPDAHESLDAPNPYAPGELAILPDGAHLGLGTGNPVRAANLRPGETVVDLGCGAGVDVFLAASAVGPTGRAIGIDITPEMIQRARENAAKSGLTNVEFHESPIEALPLPDASADVVVSNCVVNLSPDKPAVLREAWRVLRPGGRFVVSDTLRTGGGPRADCGCSCADGSMSPEEWERSLGQAGFACPRVTIEGAYAEGVSRGIVTARKS